MKKSYILFLLILCINILALTGCNEGKDNYKQGLAAYEEGDYETASKEFKEAISLSPYRGDYFLSYGNTLLKLENYEEAINIFNQVITDKDSQEVRQNNKKACYGKGIAYYNIQEYKKAIEQFDLALAINEIEDMNLDILLYKGDSQIAGQLYEDAIETLSLAIDMEPSDPNMYLKRANVYTKLKEYSKAEADLDEAISQEPDNYDYYFAKYTLLEEQNKEEEGKRVLDSITKIKTEDTQDIYNNAKANYYLENYEAAESGLITAVLEGIVEGNFYLARIMEEKEEYVEAISFYEEFLTIPNDVSEDSEDEYIVSDYYMAFSYNQMGYCYLELEQFEQAIDSFNKGLEIGVSSLEETLLVNKIVALEYSSNYVEAYNVLQEYITKYPDGEETIRELDFVKTRLPEVSTDSTDSTDNGEDGIE